MIKSQISEQPKPEPTKDYPYLGKNEQENFIVLFSGYQKGTVVWSDNKAEEIGNQSEYWAESDFTQFNGTITLKNED